MLERSNFFVLTGASSRLPALRWSSNGDARDLAARCDMAEIHCRDAP
jgi:hypothetical protein